MKICVIKGGLSNEREVSLSTGKTFEQSVINLGHELISFDLTKNNIVDMMLMLQSQKPDFILNALHGPFGEDGTIQGIFEMLRIPYSHSHVLASALAMNKIQSKYIFEQFGLTTPQWEKISIQDLKKYGTSFLKPFFLKPISEGSTIGVSLIKTDNDLKNALSTWNFGVNALIEKQIKGRELTVSLLDDEILGIAEIIPLKSEFSDYEAKYTEALEKRLIPAPITHDQAKQISALTKKAHYALGCTGLTRTDFIFDGKDFYILELNTQPGFTPTSFAPLKAKQRGWTVDQLVQKIIDSAFMHHNKLKDGEIITSTLKESA